MSSQLHFDLIEMKPLSWTAFRRRYEGSVRPDVEWKKINAPKMGLSFVHPGVKLHLVWYHGGSWRDGRPQVVESGAAKAVIRIPAVLTHEGKLVALDGCHRLTQVKPVAIFVDWFKPLREEEVYITDLFNRHLGGSRVRDRN